MLPFNRMYDVLGVFFLLGVMAACTKPGAVTDIDGNVYPVVVIGQQEWMAENLRVVSYRDGSEIATGLHWREWREATIGAYAVYPLADYTVFSRNDVDIVAAYGKLYNWYAVADPRGICPEGWRVPADEDWARLTEYLMENHGLHNDNWLDNVEGVGNALKAARQVDHPRGGRHDTEAHPRWNSGSPHHGYDEYGFAALPGGTRRANVAYPEYGNIGGGGYWWTATESSQTNAWFRRMTRGTGSLHRLDANKGNGFSVRCMRDS